MIVIDSREPDSQKALDFFTKMNVEAKIDTLFVGDLLVDNFLVIELKSIPDFIKSIKDQRLIRQRQNMTQYRKKFVIIHGNNDHIYPNGRDSITYVTNHKGEKIRYLITSADKKRMAGFITSLRTKWDTHVDVYPAKIYCWFFAIEAGKKCYEERDYQVVNPIYKSWMTHRHKMLIGADGIGQKLVKILGNHPIAELCKFDEKDFANLNGIGKGTAKKIYNCLHT